MPITDNQDHVEEAKARLPRQFDNSPNLVALVGLNAGRFQDLNDTLIKVHEETSVLTGYGKQLDNIAQYLNLTRITGESDSAFAARIIAETAVLAKSGEPEHLIETYKLLTSAITIFYAEYYPAGVQLTAHVASYPEDPDVDESIVTGMDNARAGGVDIALIISPETEYFMLDSSDNVDGSGNGTSSADYGLGSTSEADGGRLSRVISRSYLSLIERYTFFWVSRASAADNDWRSICWSPELSLFVAVALDGTGNRVMTSPDGINWTTRTSAADNTWYSVCWSPELTLFVAVAAGGTGNRVMTSPDGVTWTIRTSAADNNWLSICWSPELSLFVAVALDGTGNRVMTSPDGINWTTRTSAADNDWRSVCWSPELTLFVAVAGTGAGDRVMTSPDGVNWTIRTSAADNNWFSVCWSPELTLFVAVATNGTGNRVMTSPDGVNWTIRTSAADNNWYSVCWSPELTLFVAVAGTGAGDRVMTSPDGVTWTIRTSAADNNWFSVCWSPELTLFASVSGTGTGNRVMTSSV
jgi:hypothetical protein